MNKRAEAKLSSCTDIYSGFAFKSTDLATADVGYPVIKIAQIQNKQVLKNVEEYFPENKFDPKLKKYLLKKDTLIAMTGAGSVGKVGRMRVIDRDYLVNQRVAIVRSSSKELDNNYLYYFLAQEYIERSLYDLGLGAGQPNISPADIGRIDLYLPSLPIQRKIAAILSSYDDLIENNNRRIAILEKMAEELYREWFVRLRFPGHEKVKIVKGVPEGWEVKRIGECFTTFLGGTPSREMPSYWGGNIPWINSGEINNKRITHESEFITDLGYSKSATRMMPIHTTVLAITGATLGQVSFTELEVCANQSVVGIYDDKDIFNYYIFGYIKSIIQNIIAKQGGGGQQHINKDIVEKEHIILPNIELVNAYNKISSSIFKQIAYKYFSNKKLTFSRDRLLSRLMSGKIDVEDMDIHFPPSMEEEESTDA